MVIVALHRNPVCLQMADEERSKENNGDNMSDQSAGDKHCLESFVTEHYNKQKVV